MQLIVLNRLTAASMVQPIGGLMKLKLIKLYLMFISPDPCYLGTESSTNVSHGKRNCVYVI